MTALFFAVGGCQLSDWELYLKNQANVRRDWSGPCRENGERCADPHMLLPGMRHENSLKKKTIDDDINVLYSPIVDPRKGKEQKNGYKKPNKKKSKHDRIIPLLTSDKNDNARICRNTI